MVDHAWRDSETRLDGSTSAMYWRAIRELALQLERVVFTGKRRPTRLPWHPVPGVRCPFCDGRGEDTSGPGSWSCDECDRTGYLPTDWRSEAHLARMRPSKYTGLRQTLESLGTEFEVLTVEEIEQEKWRAAVEYYRKKAIQYRIIMHWTAPEVDHDAPMLPDGTTPDRPTEGPYKRD